MSNIFPIFYLKKILKKKNILYFRKYLDLLNQKDLEAIFITLPNYLAPIVTISALKKNIHVFCEKPPSKNVKDLKKVIKIEKRFKNLKLKYGFNHRYHGSVIKAKEILNSRKLGKIINF